MRRVEDVGQFAEGRVQRGWFGPGDVEQGEHIGARGERAAEAGLVYDGTARSIDESGSGFEAGEVFLAQHADGAVEQGRVATDHVGAGEKVLEADEFNPKGGGPGGGGEGIECDDLVFKGLEQLGHTTADHAEGYEADGGAEIPCGNAGVGRNGVFAESEGARECLFQTEKDLRQGKLGHVRAVLRGGGGHANAAVPHGVRGEKADGAGSVENGFQVREGGEKLGVHLGHAPARKDELGFARLGGGLPPGGRGEQGRDELAAAGDLRGQVAAVNLGVGSGVEKKNGFHGEKGAGRTGEGGRRGRRQVFQREAGDGDEPGLLGATRAA